MTKETERLKVAQRAGRPLRSCEFCGTWPSCSATRSQSLIISQKMKLLADRHRASTSFQGSALECTVFEALPREWVRFAIGVIAKPQAEPARHWVIRQSLATSWWRSARRVNILACFHLAIKSRHSPNESNLSLSIKKSKQIFRHA